MQWIGLPYAQVNEMRKYYDGQLWTQTHTNAPAQATLQVNRAFKNAILVNEMYNY